MSNNFLAWDKQDHNKGYLSWNEVYFKLDVESFDLLQCGSSNRSNESFRQFLMNDLLLSISGGLTQSDLELSFNDCLYLSLRL